MLDATPAPAASALPPLCVPPPIAPPPTTTAPEWTSPTQSQASKARAPHPQATHSSENSTDRAKLLCRSSGESCTNCSRFQESTGAYEKGSSVCTTTVRPCVREKAGICISRCRGIDHITWTPPTCCRRSRAFSTDCFMSCGWLMYMLRSSSRRRASSSRRRSSSLRRSSSRRHSSSRRRSSSRRFSSSRSCARFPSHFQFLPLYRTSGVPVLLAAAAPPPQLAPPRLAASPDMSKMQIHCLCTKTIYSGC